MTKNDAVVVVQKHANPLIAKAEKLEIKTPEDVATAAELLSQLNKYSDMADAEKQTVLGPLNQARTAELKRWKPIETLFGTAIDSLRKKMTEYQTAKTNIADHKKTSIAGRIGSGRGKLTIETASKQLDQIDTPAGVVTAESGTVQFIPHPVVDITPLSMTWDLFNDLETLKNLMRDGIIVWDEVAIRREMLSKRESGNGLLPGVVFRIEQRPKNFR